MDIFEKNMASLDLTENPSLYLSKRRNTEHIPNTLDPFRCRQNNHSFGSKKVAIRGKKDGSCLCPRRRHTLVPGATELELFEKETKLIVLEFLQINTPRLNAKRKSQISDVIKEGEVCKNFKTNDDENKKPQEEQRMKKRQVKRERKVSKSKTITLGERGRQELDDYQRKDKHGRSIKRSTSDLTSQQYQLMKRKFEEMKGPLIQWIQEHVEDETEIQNKPTVNVIPKIITSCDYVEETLVASLDISSLESLPENELFQGHTDFKEDISPKQSLDAVPRQTEKTAFLPLSPSTGKPSPNNLRLAIPRRSFALQLAESNLFTPETIAVQKLEKISQDIMSHHGDVLAKSIGDLLNPIQATNSITYDLFSTVARTVYDVATLPGRGTLSGLAMVLNLVKEAMVEGNLNETQLEELVDHSTKFFTENAEESPLKEGKGWEELGINEESEPLFTTTPKQTSNGDEENETNPGEMLMGEDFDDMVGGGEDKNWTPFGLAAFAVGGIGLVYSSMKT